MNGSTRWLWLLTILGVAAIVRIWGLDLQSFSMDEAAVLRDIQHPYPDLIHLADSFPPLYVALLKAWLSVFPGDVAARGLSALLGLIAVLAIWAAGREIGGERTGLVAAGLLALSAFHVFYSQSVRPYSLYVTLVAAALYCFVRGARSGDLGPWLGFALACVLGVYTHYYFPLFVAASFLGLIIVRGRGAFAAEPLGAYVIVGLMSLAVLPLLSGDLAYQTSIRMPRPMGLGAFGYTYFAMFSGFALGPSKAELNTLDALTAARMAAPWLVALGILLIAPLLAGLRTLKWRRASMLVILAVLPLMLAGGLGLLAGVTYNVRFVAWCVIPVLIWIAAGATSEEAGRWTRLSVLGIALIQLVGLHHQRTDLRYHTEDMRGVAQYLATTQRTDVPVFVCAEYMARALSHYMEGPWVLLGVPGEDSELASVTNATEAQKIVAEMIGDPAAAQTPFWFVYSREFHGDPDGHLLAALTESVGLTLEKEFAGARLYRASTPHGFTLAGSR